MMRCFFDTNILVYMFDQDSPEKKDYACRLFETEVSAGRAVVSTQVLQEFYVTVTRKLSVPLDPKTAEEVVRNLSLLRVIQIDVERILGAMARGRRMKISFWDSLIIEAALSAGANRLLTEDLNHGQVIDGLKIENPFWH
ncbi:MAG: PIN domain-containing protein [Deltaproteobacteria bacterium]|nr:PIN domain-containing protein [Deltaproteobacteria bacterium]